MHIRNCLIFVLAAVAPASAALASEAEPAMVTRVVGKDVSWQHGEKSSSPRVQTLLSPGDTLSAGKGSLIEVQYLADGCTIRVDAGGSAVVGATSPCSDAAKKSATSDAPADEAKVVPAAAGAVEVSEKNGPVTRIDFGDGLVDAKVGDTLKVGDQVFAGAKSSVTLYFAASGCSYTVPAGTVFKVSDKVPCRAPASAQNGNPPPPPEGVAPGVLLGAGAAVLGGAAIVVIISNTDDGGNGGNGNPATPD